jgi:hypothetical protein
MLAKNWKLLVAIVVIAIVITIMLRGCTGGGLSCL